MVKVNVHVTIEYDIWEAAKRTGHNLSEICEQALAVISDVPEEMFADVMELKHNNKILNELIYDIFTGEQTPQTWAKIIRDQGLYNATPVMLRSFVDELTQGDKEYYEKLEKTRQHKENKIAETKAINYKKYYAMTDAEKRAYISKKIKKSIRKGGKKHGR